MSTLTSEPSAPAADASVARVVRQKTAYWQQQGPAANHLRVSGVRPGGLFAPVYRRMLAAIPSGSRILDVGCGHGRLAIPLAEAGHRVVATDVSRAMLDLLAEHKGDLPIEIRQGDAHHLSAADDEFDVILSADFLPHFPDWRELLAEQARVCRPGGRILFAFNFAEHRTFAEPFGAANFEHPYSPDPRSGKPFWAECPLEDMIAAGVRCGLTLTEVTPLKFLHDSHAFGGALGTAAYREFQSELGRRLDASSEVAEFFAWLEQTAFQRLPFFAAYSSLVVFVKETSNAGADSAPVVARPEKPLAEFLSEIPSETSLAERQLLFELFARRWDGHGAVVEIGPFLGGTTRAIACGMAHNLARQDSALLHTFDRFDAYYSAERLRETIEPMVKQEIFSSAEADDLCRSADFKRLFSAIHAPHDYHRLVRLHDSPLPDLPEEVDAATALDVLAAEPELGALFIDGCKSWASTHYAMKFLLPRLRVGAPVIFQDFGWYTCFWITSAAHALREYLAPESRADSTYVFRLARPITAEECARLFACTPAEMPLEFFADAAQTLFERCQREDDRRGELIAQLHHVAALVTLDRRPEAARILNGLDVKRYAAFRNMIQGCIKSPTYLPGGRQLVWKTNA